MNNAKELYDELLGHSSKYCNPVGNQLGFRFVGSPIEQTMVVESFGLKGEFILLTGNLINGTPNVTWIFHWSQCNIQLMSLEAKYVVNRNGFNGNYD